MAVKLIEIHKNADTWELMKNESREGRKLTSTKRKSKEAVRNRNGQMQSDE
jgi:hypothetical protein